MPDRRTGPVRGWRPALTLALLCLAAAPSSGAAQEPAARLRVPGVTAACRAAADQRARHDMRLDSVEWSDGSAGPDGVPSASHAATRVEITGRARSAGGWVRLTADCTYAKGRPAVVSLESRPVPALDLSGGAPFPEPPRPAMASKGASAAPGPAAAAEPAPAVRLTPTLREMPFDPLTTNARRQDFIGSHEFAIKLQTPF